MLSELQVSTMDPFCTTSHGFDAVVAAAWSADERETVHVPGREASDDSRTVVLFVELEVGQT